MARATVTFDAATWCMDSDGVWLSMHTKDRATAIRLCEELTSPHVAEIRPSQKKRSLDANAYMWVLLDKLSTVFRVSKIDIYKRLIKEVGGVSETVCVQDESVSRLCDGWSHNGLGWVTDTMPSKIEGCTNVVLYYGSSTYDTEQIARLIDLVVQECTQQGIETLPPSHLASMGVV